MSFLPIIHKPGMKNQAVKLAIIAIKLTAFIKKHHPSPNTVTIIPAIEGPSILAIFTKTEFSAIALLKSLFFSIISIKKDCLIGRSKVLMIPPAILNTKMCHTWIE